MIEIHIKTIPHGKQRYDTLGDWTVGVAGDGQGPEWHITVSHLYDWRMEFCVALHELVEAALCRVRGITQQQVDSFDFASDAEEPGDDPAAPYHEEHILATGIENIILAMLGISLSEYEAKCRNPVPDSMLSARPEMAQDLRSD